MWTHEGIMGKGGVLAKLLVQDFCTVLLYMHWAFNKKDLTK